MKQIGSGGFDVFNSWFNLNYGVDDKKLVDEGNRLPYEIYLLHRIQYTHIVNTINYYEKRNNLSISGLMDKDDIICLNSLKKQI